MLTFSRIVKGRGRPVSGRQCSGFVRPVRIKVNKVVAAETS
jgi:hypothetical protein